MEVLKALPEHVLQYLCITLEYVVEDVQGDGLQSSLFLVQVKELLEFDSVSIVADQALELVGDDVFWSLEQGLVDVEVLEDHVLLDQYSDVALDPVGDLDDLSLNGLS